MQTAPFVSEILSNEERNVFEFCSQLLEDTTVQQHRLSFRLNYHDDSNSDAEEISKLHSSIVEEQASRPYSIPNEAFNPVSKSINRTSQYGFRLKAVQGIGNRYSADEPPAQYRSLLCYPSSSQHSLANVHTRLSEYISSFPFPPTYLPHILLNLSGVPRANLSVIMICAPRTIRRPLALAHPEHVH